MGGENESFHYGSENNKISKKDMNYILTNPYSFCTIRTRKAVGCLISKRGESVTSHIYEMAGDVMMNISTLDNFEEEFNNYWNNDLKIHMKVCRGRTCKNQLKLAKKAIGGLSHACLKDQESVNTMLDNISAYD